MKTPLFLRGFTSWREFFRYPSPATTTARAFSLVELLVVIAIVAILAGLVVPATSSIFQGNSISRGGDLVQQALVQARQVALTKNRRTEVRFYKYVDPNEASSTAQVRALQVFEIDDNGSAKPVTKVTRLPANVLINESSTLSNLIADSSRNKNFTGSDPQPDLPGISSYTTTFVRFFSDGSTDLSPSAGGGSGKWYLTVHSAKFEPSQTTPPANFLTVQIDPINGTVRSLRP